MKEQIQIFKAQCALWRPAFLGGGLGLAAAHLIAWPEITSVYFILIVGAIVSGYLLLMVRVFGYASFFATSKHKLMEQLRKCPGQGGLIQHIKHFFMVIFLLACWAILGMALRFNQVPWELSSQEYFSVYLSGVGILLGMFYQFYKFQRDILAYERGEGPDDQVFHWELFWSELFFPKKRKPLPEAERPERIVTLTPDSYKAEAEAILSGKNIKS